MLLATLASEDSTYNKEHIRALREALSEQQEDLVQLRTIIDHIRSCKGVSLDHGDVEKYTAQLLQIEDYQHRRFSKIDEMRYHNRKETKKRIFHGTKTLCQKRRFFHLQKLRLRGKTPRL